ncbi:MAG TPA: hypothetical protein PLF98_00520 [Thermotogota bacterium]|nr:hypothetical protein [Thermotogota bacterium]
MDRTDNKKGPEKGPAPFQDDIPFKSREDLTSKRFTLDKTEYIIFGELKAIKYLLERNSNPDAERIYLAYQEQLVDDRLADQLIQRDECVFSYYDNFWWGIPKRFNSKSEEVIFLDYNFQNVGVLWDIFEKMQDYASDDEKTLWE